MSAAVLRFGPVKKRPSKKVLTAKYVAESTCQVQRFDESGRRGYMIRFWGALASLPSLKNKKLPGKNFPNPDVMAKIAAMDILFSRAESNRPNFGKMEVFVALVSAGRARSFDLIGCMETVQDWMEPAAKMVGKKAHRRGWGIGLIENDSQVTPFMCRSDIFGISEPFTSIYIVPINHRVRRLDLTPMFVRMGYISRDVENG